MWLEQLFQGLEYDSRTQIFVYFMLIDVVCHGVNAFLLFSFFFTFPPTLSSSTFWAYKNFSMYD